MAVSSFKSSSRRGNNNNNQSSSSSTNTPTRSSTTKNPPIRRSRSVSAFSRTTTTFDTEFLNKRDNPLFDQISKSNQTVPFLETSAPSSTSRGRSVARNVEPGRNKPGRSVSRVDTGRRSTRSASQCPVSRRSFNYSTSEVLYYILFSFYVQLVFKMWHYNVIFDSIKFLSSLTT